MAHSSYAGYLAARDRLCGVLVLTQSRAHPGQNPQARHAARRSVLPGATLRGICAKQGTRSGEGNPFPRMGGVSPGRGGPSPRRGGDWGDGLALFVFIYGYPCQKFSVKGLIARACKKGACKERLRRVKPHYSVIRCNYM